MRLLAIDWGGTFLKSGIFCDGNLEMLPMVPSHAEGSFDDIRGVLERLLADAGEIDGAAVSIPGPFDYQKGISYMEHKFRSLYNQNMKALFGDIPVRFVHDGNASVLGEYAQGSLMGCRRAAGITLGTGLGAAFLMDGRPLNDDLGSPAGQVTLWNRPFKDGIAEDYISARGILKLHPAESVAQLAHLAEQGDPAARQAWLTFGELLRQVLAPWAEALKAERISIGGQIAKAFPLFKAPLEDLPVVPASLGESSALIGAAASFADC